METHSRREREREKVKKTDGGPLDGITVQSDFPLRLLALPVYVAFSFASALMCCCQRTTAARHETRRWYTRGTAAASCVCLCLTMT